MYTEQSVPKGLSALNALPTHIMVVYEPGEGNEFRHFLEFMRDYYEFTEDDLKDAMNLPDPRFPVIRFLDKTLSLKGILLHLDPAGDLEIDAGIEMTPHHQLLARAYLAKLEQDPDPEMMIAQKILKVGFEDFYGTRSELN
jgi:hypothetical protein